MNELNERVVLHATDGCGVTCNAPYLKGPRFMIMKSNVIDIIDM